MKLTYTIDQANANQKISKYLRSHGISRRILKRIKYNGGEFLVNLQPQHSDYRLQLGDQLLVTIPDLAGSDNIVKIDQPLSVIFEDEYYLAANKPPNLPSIPKRGPEIDNVASRVKNYLAQEYQQDLAIHLITRLDSDTSGVILFAKNSLAHSLFFKNNVKQTVDKEYLAIVAGQISRDLLLLLPLARSAEFFLRRVVTDQGKSCATAIKVQQVYQEATALQIRLLTGRTHQIRAHLSAINHPIYGDELYGGNHQLIARQALHCQQLTFLHPFTHQLVKLNADIPADLEQLLDNFRPV